MSKQELFIIFPYHEESSDALNLILKKLAVTPVRILVVDDCSTPPYSPKNTAVELIRNTSRLGKGASIMKAVAKIAKKQDNQATAILTADADGQHLAEDILSAIEIWLKLDSDKIILSGSRKFDSSNVPLASKLGSFFSSLMICLETGRFISDTQNGLRIYPLSLFKNISICSRGFGFETETLVAALRNGYDIKTFPIRTIYIPNRKSRFKIFSDTLSISILHAKIILSPIYKKIKRIFQFLSLRLVKESSLGR